MALAFRQLKPIHKKRPSSFVFFNVSIFGKRQTDDIKVTVTEKRYFTRSKFLRKLVQKELFWPDAINVFKLEYIFCQGR